MWDAKEDMREPGNHRLSLFWERGDILCSWVNYRVCHALLPKMFNISLK